MTEKKEAALARIEEYAIVAMGDSIADIMAENLGDDGLSEFSLDRIRIPAGGGIAFEIPTLEGSDSAKTIEGVVVGWKTVRGYYANAYDGSNNPPDCSSNDGEVGMGDPGGYCSDCPLNAWGSDPKGGKGKACAEKRMLFVLRKDDVLPIVIMVPPTSLKGIREYFRRLTSKAIPYYGVVTQFSLKKAQSSTNITYSELVPAFVAQLSAEDAAVMRGVAGQLKKSMSRIRATEEDLA